MTTSTLFRSFAGDVLAPAGQSLWSWGCSSASNSVFQKAGDLFFGVTGERWCEKSDSMEIFLCILLGFSIPLIGISLMYETFVYRWKWSARYKVQEADKWPDSGLWRAAWREMLTVSILSVSIFAVLGGLLVSRGRNVRLENIPSDAVIVLQIVVSMFVTDAIFYWGHRSLHVPFLYGPIHKKHHKFYTSTVAATGYGHPLESAMNMVSSFAGPVYFSMHPYVLFFYMVLRFWESVDAHSGYALPFSPWTLSGQAVHHDFHHSVNKGSFGVFWFTWDKWCGTGAAYDAFAAKKLQKKGSKSS